MPLTLEQKCKIIQSSVWPAVLYGADSHLIGKEHFNKLRRAACDVLVGHRKQANPYLAMMLLSKFIMDPLLYVLASAVRAPRRLASIYPQRAQTIVKLASEFQGKTTFGPAATSFARYLRGVDPLVDKEGNLWRDNTCLCNMLRDSTKTLVNRMRHHWYDHVLSHLVQRRGIDAAIHYYVLLTQKLFVELSHREQKLIMLNMVGGFQSNAVKATWSLETEDKCELCGETDHIAHGFASFSNLFSIIARATPSAGNLPTSRWYFSTGWPEPDRWWCRAAGTGRWIGSPNQMQLNILVLGCIWIWFGCIGY